MIGTVVGNYKVVEKIGEGGMGAVYKGIDLMLEREVAIKVLKPELASQPLVVERFRSEAVTLAKLNHPNIATLFAFFRQGDFFFMVLEYVNGTTLDRIVEARGAMTCEQAIPLFCQMLEGIDHAHSLGIVHRDIKPANMMLTENGLLKVLDFGIARALGSARMTRAGNLIGTIEYMSPEQVRGIETDARSDIYSLGMVLYELLTGRVPFASDSEYELMKAQVEQLPTPPREFAPNIPEEVEWAILCATEKQPENRFQTAGAFSSAIVDCVKTAIATGRLSEIDMHRSAGRLNASSMVADLLGSRPATGSQPGLSQPGISADLDRPQSSAETQRLRSATRIATNVEMGTLAAQTAQERARMTRLAPSVDAQAFAGMTGNSEQRQVPSTFFSRLNWKHYAAGGSVAGALVLGIAILLVSVLLKGGAPTAGTAQPSPTPVEQPKSERIEETESAEPSQSRHSTDSVPERSSGDREPARDTSNTNVSTVPETQAKGNGRARAPGRNKPRRGAKDLMEGP
jgi:serine/threonine protein kinase